MAETKDSIGQIVLARNTSMMFDFAVVIPSKLISNIIPCVAAVRKNEGEIPIIVIDDGLHLGAELDKLDDDPNLLLHRGEKPFIFSRNINKAAVIAEKSAIEKGFVILGDDGLLESPGGFSLLADICEKYPDIGIVGATTDKTGFAPQKNHGIGLRQISMCCFISVYIPWRTWDLVGELDERFVAYGWEDNDYCHRVKLAGLKIAVHDGCFVNHSSLISTFRGAAGAGGDIKPGREIFRAKWPGVEV